MFMGIADCRLQIADCRLQIDDYELRGLACAISHQIIQELFRSLGPRDVQRDWRAVLFDDELKAKEAAAFPLGVDHARDGVEKAGGGRERQPVAIVERHVVGGSRDETWEKGVPARA
jgi:hypothetical protein